MGVSEIDLCTFEMKENSEVRIQHFKFVKLFFILCFPENALRQAVGDRFPRARKQRMSAISLI
jgi:hypothetical protein